MCSSSFIHLEHLVYNISDPHIFSLHCLPSIRQSVVVLYDSDHAISMRVSIPDAGRFPFSAKVFLRKFLLPTALR